MFSRWWFQIVFMFTPILGEMIQFDDTIFQTGWFNHQLVTDLSENVVSRHKTISHWKLTPLNFCSWLTQLRCGCWFWWFLSESSRGGGRFAKPSRTRFEGFQSITLMVRLLRCCVPLGFQTNTVYHQYNHQYIYDIYVCKNKQTDQQGHLMFFGVHRNGKQFWNFLSFLLLKGLFPEICWRNI